MNKTRLNLSDGSSCWVNQQYDEFINQRFDKDGNFTDNVIQITMVIDGVKKRSVVLSRHIVSFYEE